MMDGEVFHSVSNFINVFKKVSPNRNGLRGSYACFSFLLHFVEAVFISVAKETARICSSRNDTEMEAKDVHEAAKAIFPPNLFERACVKAKLALRHTSWFEGPTDA